MKSTIGYNEIRIEVSSMLQLIGLFALLAVMGWWWESRQRRTSSVRPGYCGEIDIPFNQEFELYHNDFSLCSKKIRVCLAELDIEHGSHHVDLIETGSYENLSRGFLAVNPSGTVPVLVHRGHPVYESHEQIRYAADHCGEDAKRLVPEEPDRIEEMQVWIDRASLTGDDPMAGMATSAGNCVPGLTFPLFGCMIEKIPFHKILVGLLFHRLRIRPMIFLAMKILGIQRLKVMKPAVGILQSSVRHMKNHLDALESKLEECSGVWILGDMFSLADISWLVIFDRMREADCTDLFLGGNLRPRVTAYRDRLFARESYTRGIWNHENPAVRRGTERLREAKKADPELHTLLAG